jgi:hypothetical protein
MVEIALKERLAQFDLAAKRFAELPKDCYLQLIDIRPNEKIPHGGTAWRGRTFSFEYARELIEKKNFNIAAVANTTGVCFMDIDLTEGKFSIPEDVVNELIEHYDTLTVRTKSGGIQLYFINDEITRYFLDNGYAANPKLMYQGKDAGEIRTNMQYVLFPGSYVPLEYDKKGHTKDATGLYTVIRDRPLAKLNHGNLPKWFKMEQEKQQKYKRERVKSNLDVNKISPIGVDDKYINEVGLTLAEIRKKDRELDDLLMGADHIGDRKSRSEADFRAAVRLDFWRYDDNQRGSILQRYRQYDKTLRLNYLLQTVDKARSSSKYNPDYSAVIERNLTNMEKKELNELPKSVPKEKRWTLIKAPPRTGKTHRTMEYLAQNGNGVYVTNRHEIIQHALNIFRKMIPKNKTAVYLAGKDRCCNRSGGVDCDHCKKYPHKFVGANDDSLSVSKAMGIAYTLLDKHQILTPDLLMDNDEVCPYFMLQLAEQAADYCFTIPFFLMNKDNVRGVKKQNRNLMIIDEDNVVSAFYPQGYEVMTFSHTSGSNISCNNEMKNIIFTCDAIEKIIKEKKRPPWVDKELMRMIGILNTINDLIKTFINDKSNDSEDLLEAIRALDISHTYSTEQKFEIKKKLVGYEQEIEGNHNINIYEVFAPLIHIGKISFVWVGNRPRSLYFIADQEVLYYPEENYQYIVIIGSTESEMYIRDACGKTFLKESQIIEIPDFKYSKNFVLIKLESDKKKTETKMFYRLMNMLVHHNAENDKTGDPVVPFLVLESSKIKQESLAHHMKSRCICSIDDTETDQFFNWMGGKTNIFYSNSTLSRGLDIPFYDVIFADSLNFAVPYWSAMKEYYRQQGDTNKVFECNTIITKFIADEVTNSVLRCSPTMDYEFDPVYQPNVMSTKEQDVKIIVIRNSDASKILPNVMTHMREIQIIFPSGGTIDEMNSVLHKSLKAVIEIPKKVSRKFLISQLGFRDEFGVLLVPKNRSPYVYILLRAWQNKLHEEKDLNGVLLQELDSFLNSINALEVKFQAQLLVNPEIRDYILEDDGLKKHSKRSEKALIAKILARSKRGLELTQVKLRNALANMVRAGLLRSTFEDSVRYYRLPDKTLYGDPTDSKGNTV